MPWLLRMTLIVVSSLIAVYAYELWKLSAAISVLSNWSRAAVRLFAAAIVVLLNLYPVFFLVGWAANGAPFLRWLRQSPRWVDYLLTQPFWITVVVAVELLPFLLLTDLIKLPLPGLYRSHRMAWVRIESRVVVAALCIVGIYVVARAVWDTTRVRVRIESAPIEKLAPGLEGLRLVHISDVQADRYTSADRLRRYVEAVNKSDADLVVFTGDLVTSGQRYITVGAEAIGRIRSRYGVFATLGDHDFWSGAEPIGAALERRGVHIEQNGHALLEINGHSVLVTTVTDIYSQRPSANDLKRLAAEKPAADLAILISHQPTPRLLDFARRAGYQLFLAGHTHGGQVVFRPLGTFRLTPSMIETRYFSGVHRIDGALLSVNNGLGFTFAPIRYHAPAEVTLLRLTAADTGPS